MIALAAAAGGCKSSSWATKPSWWTFGGSSENGEKLAAAASADPVPKPSATAKPYPTTSTPEGYALTKDAATATGADATATPPIEPGSVTYGSASMQTAAATASRSPGEQAPATLPSITPQVGPYATLPAPPTATTPPAVPAARGFLDAPTATAASAAPAAFNGGSFASPAGEPGPEPHGTRIADARGAEAWASPPDAGQATADSRYGAGTGSRFSGSPPPTTMPQPAAAPTTSGIDAALPPASPATLTPQPTAPPAAGPSAIPTRRQDPGYRPGGTSNYRQNRAILAGEPDATPSMIRPASFESPPLTDR